MEMQSSLREYLERHGVVFDESTSVVPAKRRGRPRAERSEEEMQEYRRIMNRKYYRRKKGLDEQGPIRPRRDLSSLTPEEKRQYKLDYIRAYNAKRKAELAQMGILPAAKRRRYTSMEEREEARRRGAKRHYEELRLHEAGILTRTQVMAFSPDEAHQISFLDKIITQMDGSFLGKVGYIGLGGGSFWRSRRAS